MITPHKLQPKFLPSMYIIEKYVCNKLKEDYQSVPLDYNIFLIKTLIYDESSHFNALFKENAMLTNNIEFLRQYFTINETKYHLGQLIAYYEACSKIFPNYNAIEEGKYFFRNILKKQNMIDLQERLAKQEKMKKVALLKTRIDTKENAVFNTEIYESIIYDKNNEDMEALFGCKDNGIEEENMIVKCKDIIKQIQENIPETSHINKKVTANISLAINKGESPMDIRKMLMIKIDKKKSEQNNYINNSKNDSYQLNLKENKNPVFSNMKKINSYTSLPVNLNPSFTSFIKSKDVPNSLLQKIQKQTKLTINSNNNSNSNINNHHNNLKDIDQSLQNKYLMKCNSALNLSNKKCYYLPNQNNSNPSKKLLYQFLKSSMFSNSNIHNISSQGENAKIIPHLKMIYSRNVKQTENKTNRSTINGSYNHNNQSIFKEEKTISKDNTRVINDIRNRLQLIKKNHNINTDRHKTTFHKYLKESLKNISELNVIQSKSKEKIYSVDRIKCVNIHKSNSKGIIFPLRRNFNKNYHKFYNKNSSTSLTYR